MTPAERNAGNGDLRVLIVEDDADTARVLSRLLGISGHKVKTAGSAAGALELAGVANNTGEPFDVMVSDIGLPDKTGYELMQAIKARYSMKGIAMTGYGMDEDLRKSREAGFSEHIVKPPDFVQLERMIRRVAARGHRWMVTVQKAADTKADHEASPAARNDKVRYEDTTNCDRLPLR